MFQAPVVAEGFQLELGELCLLRFLALATDLQQLPVFLVLGRLLLPPLLPLDPPALVDAYLVVALLAPDDLAELDVFQDHVDLLELGVVDDLQEADDVGMSNLLEDGDLPFRLVLGRHGDPAQLALLGEALYDLDGYIIARLETPGQFDLAMHAATDLVDDLVLVDQLAPADLIEIDVGFVGSRRMTLASSCDDVEQQVREGRKLEY